MTSKIEILTDNIINQIAAGEVVQTPSSVVKELVENAVDAKASKIEVDVKAGGMHLIRVSDDGIGMDREDLKKSVYRHATSKIKTFEDLHDLSTMGFRGEALASIGSISKMSIQTKKDKGYVLNVEGGKLFPIEPSSYVKGTSVEVKSLFYNVPARKKFQRSVSILTSEIIRTMNNLALTYPDIAFLFISDGKKMMDLKRRDLAFKERLFCRVKEVLGSEIMPFLKWVEYEEGPLFLKGFLATPLYTKKNRLKQFLMINNRFVYIKEVSDSIREGYGMKIGDREYPVYILHMNLKKNLLDVNVHPQKKYVKITEQLFIKNALKKAVERAFFSQDIQDESINNTSVINKKNFQNGIEINSSFFEETPLDDFKSQSISYDFSKDESGFEKFQEKALFGDLIFDKIDARKYVPLFTHEHFFFLKLFSDMSKLIVVNLKSAEASINYEKINKSFSKGLVESQSIAFSCILDFNIDEMFLLEKNISFFKEMGVIFRLFSKNSIAVDAMAFYLNEKNIEDFFSLCIKELKLFEKIEIDKNLVLKKIAKDLFYMVKRNAGVYSMERGEAIVDMLFKTKDPFLDAFGGKNIISIDKEDIKKLFLSKRSEICLI